MAPFIFTWHVPVKGFRFVGAKIGTAYVDILTNGLAIGIEYRQRSIDPLADNPTLFRDFADLGGQQDSSNALAFANNNGLLGLPPREAWLDGEEIRIQGELVTDWIQQAAHLRRTIAASERGQHKAVAEAIAPFLESVSPRFIGGADAGLIFEPRTLLAAIWLQFALAVEGQKEFRRCPPPCGKWIEVSGRGNSAKTMTCSGACRQRAYRNRKRAKME